MPGLASDNDDESLGYPDMRISGDSERIRIMNQCLGRRHVHYLPVVLPSTSQVHACPGLTMAELTLINSYCANYATLFKNKN
jgi:hypothetical protein